MSVCDKSLKIRMLPAELTISKFVAGDPTCDYEYYLRELVNKSKYFLTLSGGELFSQPPSEEAGQCDCISALYEMDFKLFAGSTPMEANSTLSYQRQLIAPGVVTTGSPKIRHGSKRIAIIPNILCEYSYSQFCEMRSETSTGIKRDRDVIDLLKKLETKKNLMLFFPYEFLFDTQHTLDSATTNILAMFNERYADIMHYRHRIAPNYDTFGCFIFGKHIVFMEIKNGIFKVVECVELKESPTYTKLSGYVIGGN